MKSEQVRIDTGQLAAYATRLYVAVGLSAEHAAIAADALVTADLRGVDTHGIVRLPAYVNALARGIINPQPGFTFERRRGGIITGSADNGLGVVAAQVAMQRAVDLAVETGIAVVAMRNSNHTGMLAFHALAASNHNMVGFVTSNGPPVMSPRGGTAPVLSNNPFAYAFPTRRPPAIVIDMACSAVARGKIRFAALRGESLPEGIATDATGAMTTDAVAAMGGAVLPMGGHKGYAIALANELLAACLTGGALSFQVPTAFLAHGADTMDSWAIGHVCIALDVAAFSPLEAYFERVELLLGALRGAARDGTEVVIPGEPEARLADQRRAEGIPLPATTLRALDELADRLGEPRLTEFTGA